MACRVLIPFGTPFLYGLERAVIETFDALRPEVAPHFVQAESIARRHLPVIAELDSRRLPYSLLQDGSGWPRIGKPRSPRHLVRMCVALARANWHHARAIRRADVLYVTGPYAARFTLAAGVLCRVSGKRLVHHFHELPTAPLPWLWKRLITDYVHNTVGGREAAIAVDRGIDRKRHTVLPCVVDVEHAACENQRPIAGNGKRNLVFVGRLSVEKGVDLLIDAFGRLAGQHPDATLHLVGGCEESFLPKLRSLCERSGAMAQIREWGYRTDALQFLRDAYLQVQCTPPSRSAESFGRGVVEAMAFGVPTVCFASGALAEAVADGETGLVCQEDAEALSTAIGRFLDNPGWRDACGARARERFRQHYCLEAVRPRWLQFFAGSTN